MPLNLFEVATNIKTVVVNGMSELVDDGEFSNVGIGMEGWQDAVMYARREGLRYHCVIMSMGGTAPANRPFAHTIMDYDFMVSVLVEWSNDGTVDEIYMNVAGNLIETLVNGRTTISPSGAAAITSLLPIEGTVGFEETIFVPVVVLIRVKEQY